MSEHTTAGEPEPAVAEGLGFEPAVPSGQSESRPGRARSSRPTRHRWHRRVSGAIALLIALTGTGLVYGLFATASSAQDTATSSTDVQAGQQIFATACITCHGANLQGVPGRGPSLVGVGQAAVYFQVSTGRMPLAQQGAEAPRKPPMFTDAQIEQIAAYVNTFGGGPAVPSGNLRSSNVSIGEGGQLFRLNCAQCHGFSGKGGALSAGKYAPGLEPSTDKQIYAAMLSGPENMPVFNDNQLTPDQKKAIVNYIQTQKAQKNPGGDGIGRLGPITEGAVIWIVGVGVLMVTILWIGAKS